MERTDNRYFISLERYDDTVCAECDKVLPKDSNASYVFNGFCSAECEQELIEWKEFCKTLEED